MRLLLVEDEEKLADALAHILKKQGYDTDVAYDGDTGLYNALTGVHDLIILDRMLPGKSGVEILKGLRKEGSKIPVIFLTAVDGVSQRVEGLDNGADDYLVKPFSTEELLARIRALLRRQSSIVEDKESLVIGSGIFIPSELSIKGASKVTRLTFKESQLLELFVFNRGRTLTKERIFEKVWGYDSDSDWSIIEIYVHHLRKKLKSAVPGVKIKTVRGVGYSLQETTDV